MGVLLLSWESNLNGFGVSAGPVVSASDSFTRTGSLSSSSSVSRESFCLKTSGVSGGEGRCETRAGMVGESILMSPSVLLEVKLCRDALWEDISLVVVLDALSR